MSLCVWEQVSVDLGSFRPVISILFQSSGPYLFIWVGCLLFMLMVVVSSVSPHGFLGLNNS